MALGKQARTLKKAQVDALLGYLATTRHPIRNQLIALLSVKAGLRAKEIASLTWAMLLEPDGTVSQFIRLENRASKGRSGRVIPIGADLKDQLNKWKSKSWITGYVITTERSARTSAQAIVNLFATWYRKLDFHGCSSHSGRRTFITNAARKISTVGGSLRDVQVLAGHANLRTTQTYIDADAEAQRRVVELI